MIVVSVPVFKDAERFTPGKANFVELIAGPCTPVQFYGGTPNDFVVNTEQHFFYSTDHVNSVIGVVTQFEYFTGGASNNFIATLGS